MIIAVYVCIRPREMLEIDILIITDFSMDVQFVGASLFNHHPCVYLMIRKLTSTTNSQ